MPMGMAELLFSSSSVCQVKFEGEGDEIQFQNGLRKGTLLNINVHFLSSQVKKRNCR